MKTVLTIAGSDCSGGAGIQADIKTISAHKMYGMSVITALTAQNTTGVFGVMDIPAEFVEKQLDAVFSDIRPDAVKIGMVSNAEIINVIAEKLKEYNAEKIVLDPVMISTSGSRLISDGAAEGLVKRLMPMADIVTPNIPEAEFLSGISIKTRDDMVKAAEKISQRNVSSILVKGGHLEGCSDDLFFCGGVFKWFNQERIDNPNTHGTGCTLSSAIACGLADKLSSVESIAAAKSYITGALRANLNLGKGSGPLNHCWNMG